MSEQDAEEAFLNRANDDSIAVPDALQDSSAESTEKQPRTRGGFVVDDDEDEEDEDTSHSNAQMPSSNELSNVDRDSSSTPLRTDALSPSHAMQSEDPPHLAAQDQFDPQSPANGAVPEIAALQSLVPSTQTTPVPSTSIQPPLQAAAQSSQVPDSMTAQPAFVSAVKARLPQDRIGLLEDRIKEDPRGDLDAWLSLINEQKKRNKPDDVRATYERFFEVFPSAVRSLSCHVISSY